jgi:UDP-2-acetamido-3-amino-2,3-dideoxy-glucuronate N-acetyltransferase
VFLGHCTNVTNPRSQMSRHSFYETTVLRRGATVGANSTIVRSTEVGRTLLSEPARWSRRKNVPDHASIVGNPACQVAGWAVTAAE